MPRATLPRRALETETLPPMETGEVSLMPERIPGLTILCHPDPERIGEQARLVRLAAGGQVALSRVEPDFHLPGDSKGLPLGDPYISRRPVKLASVGDGAIRITGDPDNLKISICGEPFSGERIVPEVALDEGLILEMSGRVAVLLHTMGMPGPKDPDLGLVGQSAGIIALREEVMRAAETDVPVLLLGESGTGKELVAAAIHGQSGRRDRPYYCVNMAAIPRTTAASELFGHAKGAFTGATRDAEGYFARAHGGTLFLDEVGDTPIDVQVTLLRVLETGEIQPVGARQVSHVDVRLVAATESDLDAAIEAGRFRQSFLYRLAGYELRVPPLRERRDDIGRLLVHFLRQELESHGEANLLAPPADLAARSWLSPALVARLVRYPWPGNVRQLRNVARQLVIGSKGAPVIRADSSVERLLASPTASPQGVDSSDDGAGASAESPPPATEPASLEDLSEDRLREALASCDYRPAAAARMLGIGRTTVYKLMTQYDGIRTAADVAPADIRRAVDQAGGDVVAAARQLEVSSRALKLRLARINSGEEQGS